jgi:DNA-binding XRE family transcriptional regulator
MATNCFSSFGLLLRRYRLAARLTQEALAERAGMRARGLPNLERGDFAATQAAPAGGWQVGFEEPRAAVTIHKGRVFVATLDPACAVESAIGQTGNVGTADVVMADRY